MYRFKNEYRLFTIVRYNYGYYNMKQGCLLPDRFWLVDCCGYWTLHIASWSNVSLVFYMFLYCTGIVIVGSIVSFLLYCDLWYVMLPLTRMLPCIEHTPCVSNWWSCHVANCNLIFVIDFILTDKFPIESRKDILWSSEKFLDKFVEVCVEVL